MIPPAPSGATTVSAYDGFYIFENVPLDAYTLVARPVGARAASLVQLVTRSVIVSRGELFVSDIGIVLAERSPTVGLAAAGGSMR